MKRFLLFFAVALLLLPYQEVWAGETPIECRASMTGQVALGGEGSVFSQEDWKILIWPDGADTAKVFSHHLRKDCKIRGIYPTYERSGARFKVGITCDHKTGAAKEVWVRPIAIAEKVGPTVTTNSSRGIKMLFQAGDVSVVPSDVIRIQSRPKAF